MLSLRQLDEPVDGLLLKEDRTAAYHSTTLLGTGVLYVTENLVCWRNDQGQGFSLLYTEISLHAVSRDTAAFCHPCIYVMVDAKLSSLCVTQAAQLAASLPTNGTGDGDITNGGDEANDDHDDDDNEPDIIEIRFVPENIHSLDLIYQALSDGNVLHPDEDDSFSDDDEDNFDPEEGDFIRVGTAAPATMDTTENPINGDQFENADDDEDGDHETMS